MKINVLDANNEVSYFGTTLLFLILYPLNFSKSLDDYKIWFSYASANRV